MRDSGAALRIGSVSIAAEAQAMQRAGTSF